MEINRLEFMKNMVGIWVLHVNDKELPIADKKNRLTDQEAEIINRKLKPYTAVKLTIREVKDIARDIVLEVKEED